MLSGTKKNCLLCYWLPTILLCAVHSCLLVYLIFAELISIVEKWTPTVINQCWRSSESEWILKLKFLLYVSRTNIRIKVCPGMHIIVIPYIFTGAIPLVISGWIGFLFPKNVYQNFGWYASISKIMKQYVYV